MGLNPEWSFSNSFIIQQISTEQLLQASCSGTGHIAWSKTSPAFKGAPPCDKSQEGMKQGELTASAQGGWTRLDTGPFSLQGRGKMHRCHPLLFTA